jgi:ubiquinone/menaquinone biosynthesis C-methylase UbiE
MGRPPVTERVLERLAPARGQTMLDLAAGTGVAGFAAAALLGSGGRAIVSDFSAAMVEAAKRRAAELGIENVECRVLDAERFEPFQRGCRRRPLPVGVHADGGPRGSAR